MKSIENITKTSAGLRFVIPNNLGALNKYVPKKYLKSNADSEYYDDHIRKLKTKVILKGYRKRIS